MKYWILLGAVLAVSCVSYVSSSCQSDVNGCTTTFQLKLYEDSADVCSSLNEFVQCTYTVLQPCSIETRTLLQTGIQFLISQYTQPPNSCVVVDEGNYTVDQCTEEISYCAAYNFNGLDSKDNVTQACRLFRIYLQCMSTNTTSCSGQEELEIQTAIQKSVRKFRQCPYGCDSNIVCETQVCYSTVTQLVSDTATMYGTDGVTFTAISAIPNTFALYTSSNSALTQRESATRIYYNSMSGSLGPVKSNYNTGVTELGSLMPIQTTETQACATGLDMASLTQPSSSMSDKVESVLVSNSHQDVTWLDSTESVRVTSWDSAASTQATDLHGNIAPSGTIVSYESGNPLASSESYETYVIPVSCSGYIVYNTEYQIDPSLISVYTPSPDIYEEMYKATTVATTSTTMLSSTTTEQTTTTTEQTTTTTEQTTTTSAEVTTTTVKTTTEGTTPKPFKTSQRVTKTPVEVTQKATFPTPNYPDNGADIFASSKWTMITSTLLLMFGIA